MGRMSGGGPEWKGGPARRQDVWCSRTPRSYVGSPVRFRRIANRTTIGDVACHLGRPSVDVRRGHLGAIGHELGFLDGHAAPGVDSHPPASQGSAVLRVWRAAGKMIELDVCVDGWLRHATLRRVHRKRLPDSVDIEHECGLTNGRDDDRRVVEGSGLVNWMERLHGEPDRITGPPAALPQTGTARALR